MSTKTTARKAGGSLVVTLPKEIVDRYRIEAGDQLFVIETDQGALLTPFDPEFERAMQLYERFSRKYRNAMKKLAE